MRGLRAFDLGVGAIGFLDEKGEAWLGGVLDGQLTALHCTGAELVETCIAFELLQTGGRRLKGLVNKAGLVGERVAEALSLTKIASYGPARMWTSGDVVVSELHGTQLGACTDEAWAKVQSVVATLAPSPADLFGAVAADNPKRIPEVVALLVRGGPRVLSLAESVTSPRANVEAAIAFVRDALRKTRRS